MPAFTVPGLGSGQNTNEIVSKLVELEKKPVKRWEKENTFNDIQIKAWKELKVYVNELEERSRDIVSITTPLALKKVSTADGSVTGEAGRLAKQATRKIEVLDLATKHTISGNKVKRDITLPAGEFTLKSGKEEALISFPGGDLRDLTNIIRQKASDIVTLSLVNIDTETAVYSMMSLHSGLKGEIKIIDPNGILSMAGLVGANSNDRDFTVVTPVLSWGNLSFFKQESFPSMSDRVPMLEGPKIVIPPGGSHAIPIAPIQLEKDSYIKLAIPDLDKMKKEDRPESEVFLGVQYETPSGTRNIFRAVKGKGVFRLYLNELKGHKLTGIILGNQSQEKKEYSQIKLVELGDVKGAKPLNTTVEAKDAKFKVDGIEVTRDRNENLNDVLEGMSLTLNKKNDSPVDLQVEIETEKGIELIKLFVKAHNDLIRFSRDVTIMDKTNGPDSKAAAGDDRNTDIANEYWEKKSRTGILAGDNTLLRLVSGINRVTASSYPSDTDPQYRVLADIGISTGAVDEKWSDTKSRKGMLELNEQKLRESIERSPEGVKELFASDTNHDSRMESGVGIKLIEHLKPFTQFSTGIVESKIRMLETLVAENNKKIKNFDSHIASYEKKLKTKFMYMEQGVGKNKSVGTYLRNNLAGARGE